MLRLILLFSCFLSFWAKAQPVASFSANPRSGCVPLQVQFTSTSTGNALTYFWQFGNGNTSTLQNPQANFVVPGVYTVSLRVSNASGNDTKTELSYIRVFPLPTVKFGTARQSGCATLTTQFFDSSSTPGAPLRSFSWDFGNGNVSTLQNPFSSFSLAGSYGISLMVTDTNGCSGTLIKPNYIQVNAAPQVSFQSNPGTGCSLPAQLNFSASIQPSGTYSYYWQFGNGQTSTLANPQANYTNNGLYSVQLRVSNAAQCTVQVNRPNFIRVRDFNPDFQFNSPPRLCEPGEVVLLNTSGFDTLGMRFEWLLNDSLVSSSKHLTAKGLKAGTYKVELRLMLGDCMASKVKQNFFTILPGPKPRFGTLKQQYCNKPASVQFFDSSASTVSRLWLFGNGQQSNALNPAATYSNYGIYTVKLVATHANGCVDTFTRSNYIRVQPLFVYPAISPRKGCAPNNLTCIVQDTNKPAFTSWSWNIGPGVVKTGNMVTHYINASGKYYVQLSGIHPDGCTINYLDSFEWGDPQVISVAAQKQELCFSEQPVRFNILSPTDTTGKKLAWLVSGDTIPIGSGQTLIFMDTGYQSVGLLVDDRGCVSGNTSAASVYVKGPIASFSTRLNTCQNSRISFQNRTIGGTNFLWIFGDGDSSTQKNPIHDYDSAGSYFVRLIARDTLTGCVHDTAKWINVQSSLKADFRIINPLGCAPLLSSFVNTSAPLSQVKKIWYKVLADSFPGPNGSYLFYNSGVYTVRMELMDDKNCLHVVEKTDSIRVFGAEPAFHSTPNLGCMPILVQTRDTSHSDLPIVKRVWTWNFSDSSVYVHPDSLESRFRFVQPPVNQSDGISLKLTLIDSFGCVYSGSKKIFLSRPTPDFFVYQTKTCDKDTFTFVPISESMIGLKPLNLYWFSDGQYGMSKILKKVWGGDTTLPVRLIASDVMGCRDSITKQIRVLTGPPKVNFDAFPKLINCPGPPISFSDFSKPGSSPIVSYKWEFGDGGISELKEPARIYLLPGSYSVSLTVTDSLGCKDTRSIPDLLVIGGPRGFYSISPTLGCAPLEVDFKASIENAVKLEWDFGDGKVDTIGNTKHVYGRKGQYIPNLSLTDSSGCKVGLPPKDTLYVFPNPQVDFTVDKRLSCLGSALELSGSVVSDSTISSYRWLVDGEELNGFGPHTYTSKRTGIFPVLFEVIDIQGCIGTKIDSAAFQVFKDSIAPLAPRIASASKESDTRVELLLYRNAEPDVSAYRIEYGSILEPLVSIRNVNQSEDTLQLFDNLDTRFFNYQYRIQALDACANSSDFSPKHTTLELQASGKVNAVYLKWTPYLGWDSVQVYEVQRLEQGVFKPIARLNGTEHEYTDSSMRCHALAVYRIRAEFANERAHSDTAAAIPLFQSESPATRAMRVTVESDKLLLQWWKKQHKFPYRFKVKRYSDDPERLEKSFLLSSSDTFLLDADVDVQQYSYTYVVSLIDSCGGESPISNEAKSMVLRLDVERNDKLTEDPIVYWNPYREWASGVERYELFFFNDSLGGKEKIAVLKGTDSLRVKHNYLNYEQDDYCYEVVAYQQDSNWVFSKSNRACLPTSPRLYAPNAFTANADGLNEGFRLNGVFIKKYNLKVYDRWGKLVFESSKLDEAWDGRIDGLPAASDTYFFVAEGWGRKGKSVKLEGNVTLLR